jgi:hypothetical protein
VILSPSERCPIHKKAPYTCLCHRVQGKKVQKGSKWEQVKIGVRRIKDQFADHPDGYRYKYSPAEMRKVLLKKIEEQGGNCAICEKPFDTLLNIEADHKTPRGMNGSRRDDRPANIQAAHKLCNWRKGSNRPESEFAA